MKLNTEELPEGWVDAFENGEWRSDSLTLNDDEQALANAICRKILPRHMAPYDWNLPFAERIIYEMRQMEAAAALTVAKSVPQADSALADALKLIALGPQRSANAAELGVTAEIETSHTAADEIRRP